ncbi:MAG TPA: ABC transporter permease [Terracidiphilus sp.]|nr:ABC transporter permease [Terracidiphilus sp.]
MREWWPKFKRVLAGRQRLAGELQQEIEAHLQFLIDEKVERGMTPEAARAAAQCELGNQAAIRERSYRAWQFASLESLLQDMRYAIRGIVRTPVFSFVVILTLAVGIGANTAIFSALYAVLLKPLPFPSGERLVWLGESNGKATGVSVTWLNFDHWRKENHSFDSMAGFQNADLTLTGRGPALLTHAGEVTSGFFQLTGSRPMMGRLFGKADEGPNSPETVVLSPKFWAHMLGADPQTVGKTITLNGNSYVVIGVLDRDPGFYLRPVDFYLPIRPTPAQASKRDMHGSMRVLALLKPGVTLASARLDLNTILERLAKADPGPEDSFRAYAEFLTRERTGDVKRPLVLLMGAVGLILLLACANIGGLLLFRSTTRARELAIRTAIGAGCSRIARQLVTETLVICSVGGAFGLLLADFSLRAMEKLGPRGIPRLLEANLNVPVLIFAAALTLAVGLACAVVPVLSARRVAFSVLLKEGSAGSGSSRWAHMLRGGLVVTEIAAAVILLFTAGILLRSLWAAENVNPGFDPNHVLALELQLPPSRYKGDGIILDFYRRLETALRAQPGVASVGAVVCPPAAGDCGDWWYSIVEKPTPSRGDVPLTLTNAADSSYFQTMRIPILAGRALSEEDRAGAPAVAVINETLARKWWKDPRSAVGEHVKLGGPYRDGPVVEIVGVAGNEPQMGLDAPSFPQIYFPAAQSVQGAMVVMIRTLGAPETAASAVRHTLASIDSNVPIQSLKTADQWLGATLVRRRFITLLLALFAAIAVILAAIGCYGVLNYWVNSRKQEIAIRMALGAGTLAILRRTGNHAATLGVVGLLVGLAGSWFTSRWVRSLVFGISSRDPAVLVTAALLALLIVAFSAAVPLWRATHVDPIETLHEI